MIYDLTFFSVCFAKVVSFPVELPFEITASDVMDADLYAPTFSVETECIFELLQFVKCYPETFHYKTTSNEFRTSYSIQ